MSIKYKCTRCCNFETPLYFDIKKHFIRKYPCKKNKLNMFMSDDQLLCSSLIPFYDNVHKLDLSEIEHLKNSKIIDKNRHELFDELKKIEINNIKICKYCSKEFPLLSELKKHIIINCFHNEMKKKENNTQNNMKESINSSLITRDIIGNVNSNINSNINSNTNIFFEINAQNKTPIPFDNDWDISKISEGDKAKIMISNYMYTTLLDEILKNNENLNVIIDKEKESAMVYKNDNEQYKQMKLTDIIDTTMNKLHKHLKDINNNDNGKTLKEVITFTRQIIDKKYIDYNKDENIKTGVAHCISKSYENIKDEAIEFAKSIPNNNLYSGY